jgi:hypothetical protein
VVIVVVVVGVGVVVAVVGVVVVVIVVVVVVFVVVVVVVLGVVTCVPLLFESLYVTTVMTVKHIQSIAAEHKAVITPRVITFWLNIMVGVSTLTDVSQEPCWAFVDFLMATYDRPLDIS